VAKEDNSSPSIMWAAIIAAVVLAAILVPLAMKPRTSTAGAISSEEVEARIAPVARVELTRVAVATGPRTAEQIYNAVCTACHGTGAAGAHNKGDKAAWAPRLAQGIDGLVKSATAGKGGMPPKGGAADLSDAEFKAVVEYVSK
jgi:cytochrome c5